MSDGGLPSSSAARTVILGSPKQLGAAAEPEASAVPEPPDESVEDDARGTESPTPPPVTELVDGSLGTREVRDHAAPALKVLLDLRQAKTCEEHLALLGRVIE